MFINAILMILAIWLFIRFLGLIFRIAGGVLKFLLVLVAIMLWPVSLLLLISFGAAVVSLPVILICGLCILIGKAVL